MAHFAQLIGDVVAQVIVLNNETIQNLPFPESEPVGAAFCQSLFGATTVWKQTSYNASFRKNFAGVGFTYDPALDAFIPPQPFPSWLLNTTTCQWEPPVPYPTDGLAYEWNEETTSWMRSYTSFTPSPDNVIAAVMDNVSSDDTFYDLGSGDGRVLLAAKKIGAQVHGVEIDQNMIDASDASVKWSVSLEDAASSDFGNATAIYIFLDPATCSFIGRRLGSLNPGTKIFSYAFNITCIPNPTVQIFDGVPLYSWVI